MTSATTPLAIEGVKDGDGKAHLACRSINIERENGGKEKGTAPEAQTTAPEHSNCYAVNACCECGPTSTCKTARCECRKAACVCVSCCCLERCVNSAPQTQRDEMRRKEDTNRIGTGKRKRRQGKVKGGQPTQQTPRTRPGRAEKERCEGKASGHTSTPLEGEGTAGDETGYTPTPEDLCLQEVYGDWVHANPSTHLDGGIRDDLA